LAVPTAAAVVTLVVMASLRDYYSGDALLAFVVGWTLWIGIGRFAAMQYSPRVRMLWIGSLPNGFDADDLPGLDVQVALRPPETWDGWEIVVAGTHVFESEEWRTWLLHAELGNAEIVTEYKAREVLTGRVPLEVMREHLLPIAFHERSSYTQTKRAFDLLAVVLFSPLILLVSLIVAIVVLIDAGAPVLYIQERVGRAGRPFRIYKFRTMRNGRDDGPSFTSSGDERVTPVGRFLRKFRLDEFPQFLNVLKGDMSIIGPRPEQVPFVDEFERSIPMYAYRHLVRPGITGWAQVGQGYAAGADETRDKLSYDLYYVKHQSLLLDVVIVFRTLKTVLSGFGAR
jgi:lipopolysaccharide/colanic/teichoic acid biosynthesis glycosyltransferase